MIAAALLMLAAGPATTLDRAKSSGKAKTSLGVFDRWAAFRDVGPLRCYAIAAPAQPGRAGATWRPFAAIGTWPGQGARSQLHIRLSRERDPRARVTLSVGERRFDLVAGSADAWAPDAQTDAAIIAAMRSGRSMSVETLGKAGPFADVYTLRGAATAIDAATLGCINPPR
ncbi:MAG: hypothetical protein WC816_10330 [Sphingomonas sp.]|jgi:hypothetical protein